mmetsp:Transcript_88766/g.250021  ORF Transcript_88766/g.250021 Transcript_88766/m.250021 type:complete len:205 (-) Transcript_88766:143-757(-)
MSSCNLSTARTLVSLTSSGVLRRRPNAKPSGPCSHRRLSKATFFPTRPVRRPTPTSGAHIPPMPPLGSALHAQPRALLAPRSQRSPPRFFGSAQHLRWRELGPARAARARAARRLQEPATVRRQLRWRLALGRARPPPLTLFGTPVRVTGRRKRMRSRQLPPVSFQVEMLDLRPSHGAAVVAVFLDAGRIHAAHRTPQLRSAGL